MITLDESTFAVYAAKNYDNKDCCDILELQDDLNRIKYIKRLFKKYEDTGVLKDRLVINHIIVIYNVFEHEAATRMLVFKLGEYLRYLKPFLVFLHYWPDKIEKIGAEELTIYSDDVESDEHIVETLGRI